MLTSIIANMRINRIQFVFLVLFIVLAIPCLLKAQEEEFEAHLVLPWDEVFFDAGNEDWQNRWFLDGQRAWIKNMDDGMLYSAGPVEKDDACHAVLWTKQSFSGDVKIEYDYTRMDNINKAVNIIYIQATGKEEGPYAKDISTWSHLRTIPYMRTYFQNMKLLHISYAAFTNDDAKGKKDYVRARRYPVKPDQNFGRDTQVGESYDDTGLFFPGITYHIALIKIGNMLFMKVEGDGKSTLFSWDYSEHPPITEGRIGLRHMWTRCSKYANFSVSELKQ
jgi:hypothetical protein